MSLFMSPAPKGAKAVGGNGNASSTKTAFMTELETKRVKAGSSVVQFSFNKRRVRVLTTVDTVSDGARGVVYWMSRDQRVQDNWAMLYSQKLAIKNKIPLHVVFCLMPKFLDATWRHYDFLLKGLREVQAQCTALGIRFHLLLGSSASVLPAFVTEHRMGAVVSDFSPLRGARQAVEAITAALPKTVPHCQVDAHNVVPCWVASEKLEYAARTIRNKINSKLAEFLTEFPPVVNHPYPAKQQPEPVDWERAEQSVEVDRTVGPVEWAQPGTAAGLATLDSFCCKRLTLFSTKRNDPTINALSNLSPWLHFGQISAQRAVLCVKARKNGSNSSSVDSFCEELIVRRELADNFCLYNEQYDSIQGTNAWAKESLAVHASDVREYLYSVPEWEEGRTHDPLWNAAQLQLVKEGKMHGFLRMYWAKKILEWSESPESALATAIYLNDRFSLDGRDPNGFVGCMWSICGIHDQGWAERPVFGKIRYMNFAGCKRKFDVPAFIARYGGKVHLKKANTKAAPPKKTTAKEALPKTAPTASPKKTTAKEALPKTAPTASPKKAPAPLKTASTASPKKAPAPQTASTASLKKASQKKETGPPAKRSKKT